MATSVALAVAAALMWSVVRFAAENPEEANLGDTVFQLGRAERLASEIDEGGPFLFQDPLSTGRGRNVYIHHVGDDPGTGWLAVEARLPGEPACAVRWDRSTATFTDCHGGRHPVDGAGLTTYTATVEDGQVSVDLRRPAEREAR